MSRKVVAPLICRCAALSASVRRGRYGRSRRIASHHARTKICVLLRDEGWTGVMRRDPAVFRREAKRQGDLELFERVHLSIEPSLSVRAEAVRPANTGADVFHT